MFIQAMFGLVLVSATFAQEISPSVDAVVSEASLDALPVAPLLSKAREGASKGVSEDRIAAVLREMVEAYRAARGVHPSGDPEEIAELGDALRAGASPDALAKLVTLAPDVRVDAVRSLADLLRVGVGEVEAVRLVTVASRRGQGALATLASATATLVAAGASPADAARSVGAVVEAGRTPLAAIPPDTRGPNEVEGPKDKKDKINQGADNAAAASGNGHGGSHGKQRGGG